MILCWLSAVIGGVIGWLILYLMQRRRRKHTQRLFYNTMMRLSAHEAVITDEFLCELRSRGAAIIALM